LAWGFFLVWVFSLGLGLGLAALVAFFFFRERRGVTWGADPRVGAEGREGAVLVRAALQARTSSAHCCGAFFRGRGVSQNGAEGGHAASQAGTRIASARCCGAFFFVGDASR
jgi:hypothetical protein